MHSRKNYALGFAAALALAFVTVASSYGQSKSGPGYVVVELNVTDEAGFKEYAAKVPETIEKYGGTFIVQGGKVQTIEGAEPNGIIVILKFGGVEDAQNWLNSSEYSEIKGIRQKTAETRQLLVEGLPSE